MAHGQRNIVLVDPRQPMSYTSAQSGDNYRNWWPHPAMTAFTNDSIDELERLAHDTGNVFNLSLIHISEPTRLKTRSRMPSSA